MRRFCEAHASPSERTNGITTAFEAEWGMNMGCGLILRVKHSLQLRWPPRWPGG
jgi:hypothetical protein